jgi:hypothetical protein
MKDRRSYFPCSSPHPPQPNSSMYTQFLSPLETPTSPPLSPLSSLGAFPPPLPASLLLLSQSIFYHDSTTSMYVRSMSLTGPAGSVAAMP